MSSWINEIGAVTFTFLLIFIIAIIVLVVWLVVRAHQNRISAGREDLVGRIAMVELSLAPKGIVLVEGERWTAISESGNMDPEEEVVVTRVQGLKLCVTKK